uniref:PB1 domain-containing protein n=1 Tax=Acanthochromis polyacanthus TaxID=80966 RepID=A0A3Q1HM00_9TELE
MAASEKMTMSVIFSEADIRKLTLETRPTTTEDLKSMLQVSLGLQYSFDLQFQDPEFNYELCNLTDISDLPDKPTLKIIPLLELSPIESSAPSEDHHSSADTESLLVSSMERQEPWPFIFGIPNFSVDVEYCLRQADLEHLLDGSVLKKKVPKDMKHEILEKITEHMYGYTAYPTSQQYESVAKSLISKHPCLREIGSVSGCSGWKNSITCKMANYRRMRSRSGCQDVTVNDANKPRKGELNFLPNFPEGFDERRLEQARTEMEDKMKKKTPNGRLIKQNMDLTFTAPPISLQMKRWPALFTNEQICLEFKRIVGKDLQQEFYSALDDHTTRLMEIFKAKRGNMGEHLSLDPTEKRTVTLRGLPHLLGDNPTEFFKCILWANGHWDLVNPEGLSPRASDLHPASLKIVIEGEVVVEKLSTLPEAVCLFFGPTYGLHLNYPKKIRNTFQFIQQVFFFPLGSTELKPRLQTLKNQLLV